MRISIIGLGLIGGSIALDLKKNGFATYLVGVEQNAEHAKIALERGLVDEVLPLDEAIQQSEIILLAVAADTTIQLLPRVLDVVEEQIVIDVCSIKRSVCKAAAAHPKRTNFVATHPMAGTEYSGPNAATCDLFNEKVVVFVEEERSESQAVETVTQLYRSLNMRIISMDASEHDMHTAYVSHISHLSSMSLALTVLEKEKNKENIFDLASGGFESTVRLAKSSSSMWTSIFLENSDNILVVLDEYIKQLSQFKNAIETKNTVKINKLIQQGNKINKII